MKVNLFSLFLLLFFSVNLNFSESGISEKAINDKAVIPESIESNKANKGAIIEAIFILQNKRNSLHRHLRRVKMAIMEIDHLIKDLVQERQLLLDHFCRNGMQPAGAHNIDKILVDLSIFYGEILTINLIKGIYPHYLKQIQQFIDEINKVIDQLMAGNSLITFDDLKMRIDMFDNILDIIIKEERLIKLVLESENLKLNYKKFRDRINSRRNQLVLYEQNVKDKESVLYLEQKDLIERTIKRLQKEMTLLIKNLEAKQDRINSIKHSLFKHYKEHQVYAKSTLVSQHLRKGENLIHNKLIKNDSLYWFVDSMEDIKKRLNKNFNLMD